MDFKDEIKQLTERVEKLKNQIQTEEATKNAFVMPFLQSLGYDVFNPLEIVPEFVADIGIKKGEKVDYAILKDGEPIILIECKCWRENLDLHSTQLLRYFNVTKARFGVLTNGILYRFYTDLIETNKMDEKPFLEFDMSDVKEQLIPELRKFHKSYFNVEEIVNSASELKYTNEIKLIMSNEFKNPSELFVKFFVNQVYTGRATEKVIHQFSEIVRKSLLQLINEMINERLKSALEKEEAKEIEKEVLDPTTLEVKESKIITTEEEIEGYFIVKSILRNKLDIKRVVYRDTQTYFGILLDDNNRKPICRLWLNGTKKYLGLFNDNKKENKVEILTIDDVYKYSEQLIKTIEIYDIVELNK